MAFISDIVYLHLQFWVNDF